MSYKITATTLCRFKRSQLYVVLNGYNITPHTIYLADSTRLIRFLEQNLTYFESAK